MYHGRFTESLFYFLNYWWLNSPRGKKKELYICFIVLCTSNVPNTQLTFQDYPLNIARRTAYPYNLVQPHIQTECFMSFQLIPSPSSGQCNVFLVRSRRHHLVSSIKVMSCVDDSIKMSSNWWSLSYRMTLLSLGTMTPWQRT